MKSSKKYLIMEVEFNDYADLQLAFKKSWQSMKSGKEWNRFKAGSSLIEYKLQRNYDEMELEDQIMDHRHEIVNGKLCIIIQSKMNKKRKIS
jgi:hypothetical protein